MKKVELKDAKPYAPPKHFNMTALRLHGKEETGTQQLWMGLSHFLPNGGAEMDATPAEKLYFVLEGEITVTTPDTQIVACRHQTADFTLRTETAVGRRATRRVRLEQRLLNPNRRSSASRPSNVGSRRAGRFPPANNGGTWDYPPRAAESVRRRPDPGPAGSWPASRATRGASIAIRTRCLVAA